jgi:hypothetical protein
MPLDLAEHPLGELVETIPAEAASCELLRAIICCPPRCAPSRIHELVGAIKDWGSLIRLAQEHGLTPMLFSRVIEIRAAVPLEAWTSLKSAYDRNAYQSLSNAAELIGLLAAFDREGIPAMPFKGVVLGASAYGSLTQRPAGDLDILIDFANLVRATANMLKRGFELRTPVLENGWPAVQDYFEYVFLRPTDGLIIELRWRFDFVQARFRRNLGMDWVWPNRRTVVLAGAVVPDMDPITGLLTLCLHGCKHLWSRAIWICDIAFLIHANPSLNWEQVEFESRRHGLWRPLALGLLLAHRVAGAQLPADLVKSLESDASTRQLALHFDANLFDAPGTPPAGLVPYNVRLLASHERLRSFLSLNLLRPNERDRAVLRLPRPLHFLYWAIRPFRILFDRTARI